MNGIMLKKIILTVFVSLLPALIAAQPKANESLDKIIAIVGDEIIMKSDIEGQVQYMEQMNMLGGLSKEEVREQFLKEMIDQLLLVNKAKLDSIEIQQEQIDAQWDEFLNAQVSRLGSRQRVEAAYGMSIPRLKNEMQKRIENSLLSQTLLQQKFTNVNVSPREVEEFYSKNKQQLPEIPKSVDLYHIVMEVKSDNIAKEEAFKLAKKSA
jgi:peptidyl-prolyl cis-trans isomerase SurA